MYNGIGFKISGEDAIKPFVTTKTNGLGLGLNIVSEIMIAQNGTIVFPEKWRYRFTSRVTRWCSSNVGFFKGVTIWIIYQMEEK